MRRTILLRVLVLVSGSAVLITLGFVVLGVVPVLERIAENEFGLVAERVEARLDSSFVPVARLLDISARRLAEEPPDTARPADFNRMFRPILEASPHITSVVVGGADGRGWLLRQGDDGAWYNRISDAQKWGRRHQFIDYDPGGSARSRWEELDYDARQRPWYRGAIAEPPGTVHWTRPYSFFSTGAPGITASRQLAADDGGRLVIGFDLLLRDLSNATLDARVGTDGLALVLTEDERVLALPRPPSGVGTDDWFGSLLLPATALGLPAVNDALSVWRQGGRSALGVRRFSSGGESWLVSVRSYALGTQHLWVLTLAPAADFSPAWWSIGVVLGAALLLLLVLAGALAHGQARIIARPLETLVESSRRIGALDFSPSPPIVSSITEISQLAVAQETMRQVLQRNQQSLRDQAARLLGQVKALQEAEDRINTLAFYDPLTHLPNRRLLGDRLQRALTACTRHRQGGALLFLDLDNFKTLNDTHGHDLGDVLLKEVAARLLASVREGDTVARLGGDEFVIVIEGLSADADEGARQTRIVGAKILSALGRPYHLGAVEGSTTVSVGATLFHGSTVSTDELFKQADLAMYEAKAEGRNRLCFYGPAMQARLSARIALEGELRAAVAAMQFVLHYQPQLDAVGTVIGAEALLRWQHPQRGLVSPLEFIPLLEETGLIVPVGLWIVDSACALLVEWANDPGRAALTLSVNVSARQFRHADFVADVRAALDRSGADPGRLCIELTESLLLEDVEDVIVRMNELRALGVGFSLDDFGTGYSSLSYLKRLPLTQLKIDKSFVRDVLIDPNDAAIARTIIALGHTMGLTVMAEGVETEAQRRFLAEAGCDAYQGYLFGRPGPAEALVRQVGPGAGVPVS